jgi:hypothetical protein
MREPRASHSYSPGGLEAALDFLKRTRIELRELRKVHVWKDRLQVFDVNRDHFEVLHLGYADADILPVLNSLNAVFNPQTIHEPTEQDYKEFLTGRRRVWAEDRVM